MIKIPDYKSLPLIQLGKNISGSEEIIKYCPKIFNERTLSALDNYATHKNISIRFSKFNAIGPYNTQVYISSNKAPTKSVGLKTSVNGLTRQSFSDSLRKIYNLIPKCIEALKFNK